MESDHNRRMLQEYGDELGYFGEMADKEKALLEEKQALALEHQMIDKVESIIGDQQVLEDISKEIKQITDGQANIKSRSKNLKYASSK